MTETFPHLHPSYRQYASLSDEDRVAWIKADRWIHYPAAERSIAYLEGLLTYPPRDRMPCLLLYGETGIGKTKIIRKFTRDHPPTFNEATGVSTMPVVSFQMPPAPDERDVYEELFSSIGANGVTCFPDTARRVREACRRLLKTMAVKVLIIDEVHSMLSGTYRQQRIFLNTIRYLANDLRIPLVCVGTDEARLALLTDSQLAERFDALQLAPWKNDSEFRALLASFASILPLRLPSALDSPSICRRVIEMTDGVTVRICRLIETVAANAVLNGDECITERSFVANDLVLPLVSMSPRAPRRSAQRMQ